MYNISSDDFAVIQTIGAEIYLFTIGTPYKIDSRTPVFASSGEGFYHSNLPPPRRSGVATLLNILEIDKPVHSGVYLAKKLLKVTDRLQITCVIISIIRDNAKPNDTMFDEFEAVVSDQYNVMNDKDQAFFCCKFNHAEGDVRCCAYIYNITVQAG
jgi:hypothetical protein